MGLEDDIENIKFLYRQADDAKNMASKASDSLKNRIKGGSSTGDIVKDYLLVNQGVDFPEKLSKNLYDFKEKVQKYQGEQILIVREDVKEIPIIKYARSPEENRLIPPLSFTSTERSYRLGVIAGELEFDLKPELTLLNSHDNWGDIIIPTEFFVSKKESLAPEKREGPLRVDPSTLYSERITAPRIRNLFDPNSFTIMPNEITSCKYYFGKDVPIYFRLGGGGMAKEFLKNLNEKEPSREKEEQIIAEMFKDRINPFYGKALELLNLPVPEIFKNDSRKEPANN